MTGEVEKKELEFSKEQLELIKKTVCEEATEEEFELFIELAKRYQLDPFKKQIYFISGKNGGTMVSHAGLIHIAHNSGAWAGMKTLIVTQDGEEKLLVNDANDVAGAVCYVYRKDWKEPLIHAVSFREYFKVVEDPKKQKYSSWYRMPQTMIKKVAEAGALRRAFDLGGLYIQEEMGVEETTEYETGEKIEVERPNETNKVYLIRLRALMEAIEKKFNVGKEQLTKLLEKKLGASIEEFTVEQFKQAEQLLRAFIDNQKKKEEKEKIEVKVEEPKKTDETDDWVKDVAEIFKNM